MLVTLGNFWTPRLKPPRLAALDLLPLHTRIRQSIQPLARDDFVEFSREKPH